MRKLLAAVICLLTVSSSFSQEKNLTPADVEALQNLHDRLMVKQKRDDIKIDSIRQALGESAVMQISEDGTVVQLVRFDENGRPLFYATDNVNAAATTSTDLVHPGGGLGTSLTGNGINIGEWDGGEVRSTHVELTGRVTQIDNPSSQSDHSTHVAGTMIASGINSSALGMAYQANISAYDFSNDEPEMATYATGANHILSNHSYGTITGWRSSGGDWYWYGDPSISQTEDYNFGFYSYGAMLWDTIAESAPYYLIVKSSGNDRNDNISPSANDTHQVWISGSGWTQSTMQRPADCPTGYDCISTSGNSKNILTVGAVNDISSGWQQASNVVMSTFSGWGPTDDGRIKPDIVGNGVSLLSSGSANNTDYYNSSGTSMSAPNVTGSLALVQQHYQNLTGGFMLSSALKGLAIHTANEAGTSIGPDYSFGWGLLNTAGAVELLSDTAHAMLTWDTLTNGDSLVYTYYYDGTTPLEATICWTDPAGTPVAASLDPTNLMLVNDLDLRARSVSTGVTSQPYILNPAIPSAAATTGDNFRDNVEKIELSAPTAGYYNFVIKHKGSSLTNNQQVVSLIISGFTNVIQTAPPVVDFSASDTGLCVGDTVQFTDLSTNTPNSWSWTITDGTTTYTSSTNNPSITFTNPGTYDVKLVATNTIGSDSLIKIGHIQVDTIAAVDLNFYNDVCMDTGLIALNPFNNYPGGVYSGNGVTGNFFDPIAAGLGTTSIYYEYTSPGGCIVLDTAVTEVVPGVTASHTSVPPVCLGSGPLPLTGGSPSGGVYTGPGVFNGNFYADSAGLGTHTLVYEVSNSSGCDDTAQVTIVVVNGTLATMAPLADVCENNGVITLTAGNPTGGIYTGFGVDTLNGTFDPALAGPGTHLITYTSTSGTCISGDTASITVNPNPVVVLNLGFSTICTGANPVALSGGSPSGGVYSGSGVTNDTLFPASIATGNYMIYYSLTDSNGCSAADSNGITLSNSVSVLVADTFGVCEDASPFALNIGTPSGGTYTGVGVVNGTDFDPDAAGQGLHTIYYSYNINGCNGTDSASISVIPAPSVVLGSFGDICVAEDSLILSGGSPAGGIYSGTGVTNGVFYPQAVGIGSYTITYSYTDTSGCEDHASRTINVVSGNATISGLNSRMCTSDAPVVLFGSPSGGIFSGNGVVTSTFDPSLSGTGLQTVTYTVGGSCPDTVSQTVEVLSGPTVGSISGNVIGFNGGTYTYSLQGSNGIAMQWSATNGTVVSSTNNVAQIQWGSAASGTVTVVVTNNNGCSDSTSMVVNLWAVGMDELSESKIQVYPNPTEGLVYVLVPSNDAEIIVYNTVGQRISIPVSNSETTYQLDFTGMAKGIYLLQVNTAETSETIQIVLN